MKRIIIMEEEQQHEEEEEIQEEIWKDIPGFDGYQASNLGRIKGLPKKGNHFKETILKPVLDNYGYPQLVLYKDGKK